MTGIVPEWFTPTKQPESDAPARFLCKPLTGKEVMMIEAAAMREGGMYLTNSIMLAWSLGVTDWDGVEDHAGSPLKFEKDKIEFLPMKILEEVGLHIIRSSHLSAEQAKN